MQVEGKGFYLRNNEGHLKGFYTNLKHFFVISDGKIPPALRTIQIAIKRECPRRPRGMTKMWHMLEKLISLIFRPEIPHDELINVIYFFC